MEAAFQLNSDSVSQTQSKVDLPYNEESNYVRLRGLPFSAKEDDVRSFLQGIFAKSVTFTLTPNGRASGECYVELNDATAVNEALKLHKNEMSNRYIEVFTVTHGEVAQMIRRGVLRGADGQNSEAVARNYVVRLRGIPFNANVDDLRDFFSGLEVTDVVIDKEPGGRPSGEAFVRFSNKQHAEKALERNRNNMGSRYVEVFRSSGEEMDNSFSMARGYPPPMGAPVPLRGWNAASSIRFGDRFDNSYGGYLSSRVGGPLRGGGPERRGRLAPYDVLNERFSRLTSDYDNFGQSFTAVFMRGLPYNVTSFDIEDFFKPLICTEIRLGFNSERRPSGDGIVVFPNVSQAREALSRNKLKIGTRYIELFSGNDIPSQQNYTTYRLIGGTGPTDLGSRLTQSRYSSFNDDNYNNLATNRYASGGQQFYNDQYEGKQAGYGRQYGALGTRPSW